MIDQLSQIATTYVARGNGDDGSGGRPIQPNDDRLRQAWAIELSGIRIGIAHDLPIPESPPNTLRRAMMRLFGTVDMDVLVHGDTHVEAIDHINGILCVNPGSPTYPRNLNTQLGTIGFLDVREGGQPEASIWQLTETGIEPFNWNKWRRPR